MKPSKNQLYKISISILVIAFVVYIVYEKNQLASFKLDNNSQKNTLENEILVLKRQFQEKDRFSKNLQDQLSAYQKYDQFIQLSRLRDSITMTLPFKYGQRVLILPDSLPGIINSISINANASEYSIKYIVKMKDNKYSPFSVSDLAPL